LAILISSHAGPEQVAASADEASSHASSKAIT